MDNVTHSLIGILIGCAATRKNVVTRREAVVAALLASNLADIDVLSRVFHPDDALGGLLTHRGYTHTLMAVPVIAAVTAVATVLICAKASHKIKPATREMSMRRTRASGSIGTSTLGEIHAPEGTHFPDHPTIQTELSTYSGEDPEPEPELSMRGGMVEDRFGKRWKTSEFAEEHDAAKLKKLSEGRAARRTIVWLFGIGVVAGLLHLFADFWNDYGVHPFSPFWNRWYYGDFLFILEPTVWLSALPLVFFAFEGRRLRIATLILAAWVIIMTGALSPSAPWLLAGGLAAFAAAVAAFQRLWLVFFPAPDPRSVVPAALALVCALAAFHHGSRQARDALTGAFEKGATKDRIIQLSTTPFPGNPYLWRGIIASSGPDFSYRVRLATITLAPELFSTPGEFLWVRGGRMAPLADASLPSQPNVHWIGEFQGSLLDMLTLAGKSCEFANLLKFARMPFWVVKEGRTFVGDLRYDQEPGLGFAKFEVSFDAQCPRYDAPWEQPVSFPEDAPISR